jgi:hypothetical protein
MKLCGTLGRLVRLLTVPVSHNVVRITRKKYSMLFRNSSGIGREERAEKKIGDKMALLIIYPPI